MQLSLKLASIAVLAAAAATACMGTETDDNAPGGVGGTVTTTVGGATGGSTTSTTDVGGSAMGSGGVVPVGGATTGTEALGGTASFGGSSAAVGTTAVGGATPTGGSTSTGGTTAKGGSTATGGTASSTCPEGNTLLCGILDAHNAARGAVTPVPNTPLPAMTWDATVATAAQAWADKCDFNHFVASGSNQGQNLYANTGSGTPKAPTPQAVVNNWVGENQYYNYGTNTCQSGQMCGHYTQVVWRDSTLLGCGIKYCTTNSPFSGSSNWWIVVCNYSPAGNYIGQKPY